MDLVQYQLQLIDKERRRRAEVFGGLFKTAPLLGPALGFMAGIVVQDHFGVNIAVWLGVFAACAIAGGVLLYFKVIRPYWFMFIAAAAFAGLGAVRLIAFTTPAANDISRFIHEDRALATIRGCIISDLVSSANNDWEYDEFTPGDPGKSFYMEVTGIETRQGWIKACGIVRMQVGAALLDYRPGDSVQAYCWVSRFRPVMNPGQFDTAAYMARRGVQLAASVKTARAIKKIESAGTFSNFSSFIFTLKHKALHLLMATPDGEPQAQQMLGALLLGNRADLDRDVQNAFYKTGLLHILALSGGHVAVLIALVWWLAKIAGCPKRPRGLICLIFTILFTLAVPPNAPVLRASIIGIFFCISVMLGRTPNSVNTLALSAMVLIMFWPTQFYEAGWQLSFGCVLGILLFTDRLQALLHDATGNWFIYTESKSRAVRLFHRFGREGVMLIAAGLGASLGGCGILLYQFYTITPMCVIWTIIISPLVSLILVLGFIRITLGTLLPTLGGILEFAALKLSAFFGWSVSKMAAIDPTQILVGHVPLMLVLLIYAVIIFAGIIYIKHTRIKTFVVWAAVLILLGWIGAIKYSRMHPDRFKMTCLSVGHGQAVIAQIPGEGSFLFDCGSLSVKDVGTRIVLPYMQYSGISRLDAVFISHTDVDHLNGTPEIAKAVKVGRVYFDNDFAAKQESARIFQVKMQREPVPYGQFEITDVRHIKVIWPVNQDSEALHENDLSKVFLLEFGGRHILLCSDIEQYAQVRLLELYPNLTADVIMLPHHGSGHTMSAEFIKRFESACRISSCGITQYNRLACKSGAYATCLDGAITITIDRAGEMNIEKFCK
jgi:competence protein ComEC